MIASGTAIPARPLAGVEARLARVVEAHFHPAHGSPFWIDRARERGIDALRRVRTLDDLSLLGSVDAATLRSRPLPDFIPRRIRREPDRLILGQTGGATGAGVWTAYRDDEFEEAFVEPFVAASERTGFPRALPWLFVGPSGPHLIFKAAGRLARRMGSSEPFAVDFDPRWARRMPEGSFAQGRYIEHVVEQAMDVLETQRVGALFTTPRVLGALAERMTPGQRAAIRGVHYGGMALDPGELGRLQREAFPEAVHLSGYGNTLFGCCMELSVEAGRTPAYFPFGDRLMLEVVSDAGAARPVGGAGRVRFTRIDETMLIVGMLERDEASLVAPPAGAPEGFGLPGVLGPQTTAESCPQARPGIY